MDDCTKFNIIRSCVISSCVNRVDKTELLNFIDDLEDKQEEEDY